jgi:signal transduction histidine kinase
MMKKALACFTTVLFSVICMGWSCYADGAGRDECVAKTQEAIKLAKEKGIEEAFKQINDPKGPFVWKDTYVFVISADEAIVKAHGVTPGLIGKNMLHIKDVNGVALFAELARAASSETGKGWVDYMWPKPGEKNPSQKHSYIERLPGENLAFGAGYFE